MVSQFWEASIRKAQFWAQRLCQSCSQCMVAPPLSYIIMTFHEIWPLTSKAGETGPGVVSRILLAPWWGKAKNCRTGGESWRTIFDLFFFGFQWISSSWIYLDILKSQDFASAVSRVSMEYVQHDRRLNAFTSWLIYARNTVRLLDWMAYWDRKIHSISVIYPSYINYI